jgi:hypothetical protein
VTAFGLTTASNYAWSGLINWPLAVTFIGGGVVGGYAGTKLAKHLSKADALTPVFAGMVAVVASYILIRAL